MIVLLSPSKTLDMKTSAPTAEYTIPALLDESELLIEALRKLKPKDISKLMTVSDSIASLNAKRFKAFTTPFTPDNAKQAMFAFKGDVYTGLDAKSLSPEAVEFAQKNIRILSGLYGLLRPLDLMQAYRLEMKTRLHNPRGKDLYHFWDSRITDQINIALEETGSRTVINLASEEYFKAVQQKPLNANIITPQFKEKKKKGYVMIGLFAKKARGMMARYIAAHNITNPETLHFFAEDGYRWNASLSKRNIPVFTRG